MPSLESGLWVISISVAKRPVAEGVLTFLVLQYSL